MVFTTPSVAESQLYQANFCPTIMSLGENVAGIAKQQLGVRYRSGGSSPKAGFDCSGFVHWVFARHGVALPRSSTYQAQAGRAVPRGSLLPGDILIFSIPRTPNGRHSAIYIGNGKFIHSPNSGGRVRIEELNSAYWNKHYLMARRVLKTPPCDLDLYMSPDIANSHTLIESLIAE
jgi:cell wall-associated NlpC family hydrolase